MQMDSESAAVPGDIISVESVKGLGFYSAKDNALERSYIVYVFQVETVTSKSKVSVCCEEEEYTMQRLLLAFR